MTQADDTDAPVDSGAYSPPPEPRSAYPSAAEGGFGIELDLTPAKDAPPGAGYDDDVERAPEDPAARPSSWRRLLIPLAAAFVLAALTLVGLVFQPIVVTVVVVVMVIAAGVMAALPAGEVRTGEPTGVRRSAAIAATGPALMVAYYWISASIHASLG